MYHSFGTIRIRPKSKSTPLRPWWALIECCPDLSRYYLEVARRAYWFYPFIQRPAWGGHISIIRGEEPPAGNAAWEALDGVDVLFEYTGEIETDGKHLWLPVFCESVSNMREVLGLPREPQFPFHLTFGVTEGENPNKNP